MMDVAAAEAASTKAAEAHSEPGQDRAADVVLDARSFGVHGYVEQSCEKAEDRKAQEDEQGRRGEQQAGGPDPEKRRDRQQHMPQGKIPAEQAAARHRDEIDHREDCHGRAIGRRRGASALKNACGSAGP